jgi:hypothetical protein
MILTTVNANESQGPLTVVSNPHALSSWLQRDSNCRVEIDRVMRKIESPDIREVVGVVFRDLLRLLECLTLVERYLRQVDDSHETFALFQIIHDEAQVLVDFIRADGMNFAEIGSDLVDTLDGITFAVNHDLQRVFDSEQASTLPSTAHLVVGKLYRAHDVLTNCLQQSTITLAMVFDPELMGARLFNNSDMRYRQSLQLCHDLSELLQVIENCETSSEEDRLQFLSSGIQKFRDESLEFLMYSDWPQFESFCERINVAGSEYASLASLLHQFRCYVETLLGQVRMRAVLANVSPLRSAIDNFSSPITSISLTHFAAADADLENPLWEEFAIAV